MVENLWHNDYMGAPSYGSVWKPQAQGSPVLRGGSWSLDPVNARSTARAYNNPGRSDYYVGFRVLCSSPIE